MSQYPVENIRTVALVGHGSTGKTTLMEALLYRNGVIKEVGTVEKGNTVGDFDPMEKEVKHSLRTTVAHLNAQKDDGTPVRIFLLDTPGYPDCVGQALGALDAVKTVCVVVDATKGIELMTRRMMHWAKERDLCRMIVVNKIDQPDVDLAKLVLDLREAFGNEVLPLNLPNKDCSHVIDCFDNDKGEANFASVERVHQAFVERVVEMDDETMERYLEEGAVDPKSLHAPLTKALRLGHIIPVCFTSAKNLIGMRDLIKVFVRHLPNPTEANAPLFYKADGSEYMTFPDANRPVLAHVFKVVNDPYIGKIGLFRLHQGRITKDSTLFVDDGKKAFKITRPIMLQGKEGLEVDEMNPGYIGAVAKVDDIVYGSILHDSSIEGGIYMKKLNFPKPMFGLAVSPAKRGDESRMSEVLEKMVSEDPTLEVEHDVVMNETVLRGLSEQHLRIVLKRMASQFKLEVQTRTPRVPYRETIAAPAEGHARHKKQTGGAGQFGEVFLRVEPLPRGAGFKFVDQVKGGAIPYNFIPAVEKGVQEVLDSGYVAGYPIHDVRVTVYDGKYHPVDSKEVAFVAAGRKAMLDALANAKPTLLEPIVRIEIEAPDSCMGDIAGDLASRRGQVSGTENLTGGMMLITGRVPLTGLDGYANRLNALTQGAGTYSIELLAYEPVPASVQAELASKYQRKAEED